MSDAMTILLDAETTEVLYDAGLLTDCGHGAECNLPRYCAVPNECHRPAPESHVDAFTHNVVIPACSGYVLTTETAEALVALEKAGNNALAILDVAAGEDGEAEETLQMVVDDLRAPLTTYIRTHIKKSL